MSDVRRNAERLRDRCEELARQAERDMTDPSLSFEKRNEAQDRAKAYWQMSRIHADTVSNAADAAIRKFTGRNSGTQRTTKERADFLRVVASEAGPVSRECLAAICLDVYAGRVRNLWRAEGENARSKLLTFMRNHKIP